MSTRINLWLIPGSYSPTSTPSTSSPLQLTISEDVLEIRSSTCGIEVLSLFHSTFPLYFPSHNSSYHRPQSIIISFGQRPNSLERDRVWNWNAIPWPLCSSHGHTGRKMSWLEEEDRRTVKVRKPEKGRLWEETFKFRLLLPDVSP